MKLHIYQDNDPINPRTEFDHVGRMACKHSRYDLGDEKIGDPIEWLEDKLNRKRMGIYTNERLAELEGMFFEKFIAKRLYLYDHSGITIATTPFHCRWDSGQVGYIYMTKKTAISNWGRKYEAGVYACFEAEVEEYDKYLRGEVYGFELEDDEGNFVDSCWGFWGDNWEENGIKDHLPEEVWPQLDDIEIEYR